MLNAAGDVWAAVWGQFVDHTFGLRNDSSEPQPVTFDPGDPLETQHSDLPFIPMSRSTAGEGTEVTTPREQPNIVSSYVDAWAVYGGTPERLEWMREGQVDGDLSNNGARLLMPSGLLPRRDARGNADTAAEMDTTGGLEQRAVVAGDTRAPNRYQPPRGSGHSRRRPGCGGPGRDVADYRDDG